MHKLEKLKDILLVEAYLPHKLKYLNEKLILVFDPGCALTLIDTSYIDMLGYSAGDDAIRISRLDGACGISEGYTVKVPEFECLDQKIKNFEIACHDLNTNLGIAGLLRMNFFNHFRMDIDFETGIIHNIIKTKNSF